MNYHPLDCKDCSLCENRTQVVPSIIVPNSKVMFIGEAPGAEEDKKGVPFVGDAGRVLEEALREAKINRESISISNICCCRPPENRPPQPKEIQACFPYLDKEIKESKPELLVLLGNTPLKQFLKGVGGITRVRGKWFDSEEYNCKILPTFHPAYILRNPQEKNKLVNDLKQVKNYLDGNVFNNEKSPVDYKVVHNLEQFNWVIDQLNTQDEWSFDTETTGLDFEKDEIFIFTFSWRENTAVLIDLRYHQQDEQEKQYVWNKLKEVFENDKKKIPHNGSFDIEFLLSKGIVVQNYYCDTILMDYCLDENSRHGLEVLSEKYTDMGPYDMPLQQYKLQNRIENYKDIPIEIMHPYALMDADCTFRSYKAMLPKIYEEKLDFVLFKIMMPIQKILIQSEYQGVSIDVPYLKETIIKYEKEIAEYLEKSLQAPQVKEYIKYKQDAIINKLKEKWQQSKTLTKRYPEFEDYLKIQSAEKISFEFNINSSTQLKELLIERMKLPILKKTPKDNASLDDEVLEEYAKKNKFCEYLAKYRSLSHLKSTFLDGILNRLEGDKVHTDYLLFSTVTGRPSSRDPNLNNIPRTGTAEGIKDIFCADKYPDGSSDWLIEVDQGQAEFRLWINYSKDPQALRDLEEGIDIHKLMAASAYGGKVLPKGNISHVEFLEITKDVKKSERQDTKLIIFGIMYGRGAKSVAEQLGVSVQLAQRIINLFFERYKVAKQWIKIMIALAKRDGYVTSIFGRKRRLLNINHPKDGVRAEAERQAINSPIQSAASDLTFLSCIEAFKVIRQYNLRSRLVLTVYDSLVFNIPEVELEFVSKLIYQKMMETPIPEIIVPLVPEIKIGKNWGSLMEVDLKEDWNVIQEKLNQKFLVK
jgi:DNA polymerase-1